MKPTVEVDLKAWRQAAEALQRTSSRSAADFINGQALRVAIESVRQTEKADASKIEKQLGVMERPVIKRLIKRGARKGQEVTKRGRAVIRENSFAERILLARFKETGKWGVKGSTMEQRVRAFIAARVRSRAFIASGWIGARNALFSAVRKKPGIARSAAQAKVYGKPKGFAVPAVFGLMSKFVATIGNTALLSQSREPSVPRNPSKVAEAGLSKALKIATKDMIETLAKRLKEDLKPFGAK